MICTVKEEVHSCPGELEEAPNLKVPLFVFLLLLKSKGAPYHPSQDVLDLAFMAYKEFSIAASLRNNHLKYANMLLVTRQSARNEIIVGLRCRVGK